MGDEFGGLGPSTRNHSNLLPKNEKLRAYESMRSDGSTSPDLPAGMNTTIAIVATNATLDKAQLKRLAVASQDGMARAIVPSHTPFDGDLVFALSTADAQLQDPIIDSMQLGHAAAVCLSRAIARGVYHATAASNDTLPVWSAIDSR